MPNNVTIFYNYAQITDTEKEIESYYVSIQEKTDQTVKQDAMTIIDDWNIENHQTIICHKTANIQIKWSI